jgi:hypothetical protein
MMGKTEERLRDAVAAFGETVRPADIPPLRLGEPAARRARGRQPGAPCPAAGRWLIPLGTAAAIAAIVGMIIFVRGMSGGTRSHPLGSRSGPLRLQPLPHPGGPGWMAWSVAGRGSANLSPDAITATGPGSAWTFTDGPGKLPIAWRLTGSTWSRVAFPGHRGELVDSATSSSLSDAWAFSDRLAMHWDGRAWRVVRGFPARHVDSVVDLGRSNVWVFTRLYPDTGSADGTWHYDGHTWSRVPAARGLEGATAVSATDIWAYGGSVLAHWNGKTWTRTSVASLLPRRTQYCGPMVTNLLAQSATSAWALGWQGCQDTGGAAVLLHYAGGRWHRAARLGNVDPSAILPVQGGGVWLRVDPDPQQPGEPRELAYVGGRLHQLRHQLMQRMYLYSYHLTPGGDAVFAVGARGRRADAPVLVIRYATLIQGSSQSATAPQP